MVNINFAFDPAASLYYWGILRSWIRTQSASCVDDDEVIITGGTMEIMVLRWAGFDGKLVYIKYHAL